jgi:pimeloyl-ACP methyl ester carboxylesterase
MRPGAAPAPPWRDRDADEGYGATASPNWRETDWAKELKRVDVDGTPINYVDVGSGDEEPVVLVHGLGGQWQNWLENIPRLAQERRVLALDLPGFGESPYPMDRQLDLADMADAVAALATKMGVRRVVFVGHSFGGPLGMTFASRHHALTEAVVLVAGTVQSFQSTLARKLLPWFIRPLTAVSTVAELIYTAVPVPEAVREPIARSPLLRSLALWPFVLAPQHLRAEDARLLVDGAGAPGVLPTARAIGRASGWERLQVDAPVALINGDHDRIAPLADLRTYPGRVDRAIVIKNSGHMPMLERPHAFVDALTLALLPPH